ncbi:MAG: hypothetical protein QMD99_04130 [Rhizobiaceae bacterium]|nr:hypothetical protein [Rhizobiaceae bacterium]
MANDRESLQLKEHRAFQAKFWRLERFAWIFFALILVAVGLGLSGSGGPLSRSTLVADRSVADVPRFSRWEAPDEIRITLAPSSDQNLTLAEAFFSKFQIETMQPPPARTDPGQSSTVYHFGSSATEPLLVSINLRPLHPGQVAYPLGLNGKSVSAETFVWP